MLSNVLHEIEDKKRYANEIKRVMKNNAKLFVIEWKKIQTNYGPPTSHRISQDEVKDVFLSEGLKFIKELEVSEHHYGLIFEK